LLLFDNPFVRPSPFFPSYATRRLLYYTLKAPVSLRSPRTPPSFCKLPLFFLGPSDVDAHLYMVPFPFSQRLVTKSCPPLLSLFCFRPLFKPSCSWIPPDRLPHLAPPWQDTISSFLFFPFLFSPFKLPSFLFPCPSAQRPSVFFYPPSLSGIPPPPPGFGAWFFFFSFRPQNGF